MSLRSAWQPLRLRAPAAQRFSTALPRRRRAEAEAAATTSDRTPTLTVYETIERCPEPTCACQPMPAGLDIDHESKMVMPFYDRHVVVSSGTAATEWPSRVEDEPGSVLGKLKQMMGPKGKHYRPDFAVSVHTSTLPGQAGRQPPSGQEHVYLFPDFCRLTINTSAEAQAADSGTAGVSLTDFAKLINGDGIVGTVDAQIQPIRGPVVLICGHGQRDARCGVLGPLLELEFGARLRDAGFEIGPQPGGTVNDREAYLGLISHTGGHKFAGNVILYMPPGADSPLAGKGVWYGRVEPRHVEGIVSETVGAGRVIQELLRGVHDFGAMRPALR